MKNFVYIVKKDCDEIGMDSNFNSGRGLVDAFVNRDEALECARLTNMTADCRVYVEMVEYETNDFDHIIGHGEPEVIWESDKVGEQPAEDEISDDELAAMEAAMEDAAYGEADQMDQLEKTAMDNIGECDHEMYKGVDVTEAVKAMGGEDEDEPLEENIGVDDKEVVGDKIACEYINKDEAEVSGMGYIAKENGDHCNEAVEDEAEVAAEEEVADEATAEDDSTKDETVELSVQEVADTVADVAHEVADAVQDVVEPTEEQADEVKEVVDEIVTDKVEEILPDVEAVIEEPAEEVVAEDEVVEEEPVEESLTEDKDALAKIKAKLAGKTLDQVIKTEDLHEDEDINSTKSDRSLDMIKAKLRNYKFHEDWTEEPEGQHQPGDAETMSKELHHFTDDLMTDLEPEELKSRDDNEAFGYEEPELGNHSEAEEVNVKEQDLDEDFEIYDFFK